MGQACMMHNSQCCALDESPRSKAGTSERSKRYGYIYVDAVDWGNGTFNRSRKDSFAWYKHVIETNGTDL